MDDKNYTVKYETLDSGENNKKYCTMKSCLKKTIIGTNAMQAEWASLCRAKSRPSTQQKFTPFHF